VALGVFIGWVLPSILRPLGTQLIGALSHTDLTVAAKISILPKAGTYLPVPAQIGAMAGHESAPQIWHYTVRKIIASLSHLSPSGGWNTELEGKLMNLLGKPLEKLGKKRGR
jgi:hypothetical protein